MSRRWRVGLAWMLCEYSEDALKGIFEYGRRFGPFEFLGTQAGEVDFPLTDIDGLLVFCRKAADVAAIPRPDNIPIVDAGFVDCQLTRHKVLSDHQAVGRMAAEAFLERGLKSLAYCPHPLVEVGAGPWDQGRMQGFAGCAREHGIRVEIYQRPDEKTAAYEREWKGPLADWLMTLDKPVGIMGASDFRARHILLAAAAAGLRVPEDVAIIGVDNLVWTQASGIRISSIELDGFGAGYAAMEMLHRLLEGRAVERPVVHVPPRRLIRRHSSDILAVNDPYLIAAMRFIAERATSGIGVQHVADAVMLSRRALERRFQEQLRRSILDQIHSVRIERAKTLLADDSIPIRRVATLSGFTSSATFSVIFRRVAGMTPSAYRAATRSTDLAPASV